MTKPQLPTEGPGYGGDIVAAVLDPDAAAPGRPTPPRSPRSLPGFIGKKLLITVGLLLGVTIMTFLLVQLVPGDPTTTNLTEAAQRDPTIVAAYKAKWGLDKPLPVQYLTYLKNLLHGDLGTSQRTGNSIVSDLGNYIPATLELAIPAMVLSLAISIALGMWAAVRKDRPVDHTIRAGALVGLSTPSFWLAIVVLYIFFYKFDIAPNGGRLSTQYTPPRDVTGLYTVDALLAGRPVVFWDAVWHLALPVLVLTALTVSILIRFVRSAMLEVLDQDYIKAAYAKGLPRLTVLRRHVLRAGLVQVVTVSGLAFASLLSGTVLIEQIYSWPGIGQYAYLSALNLDLPAIMGIGLFVALVYTVVNLFIDILYGIIDPRIRVS
ncbi:MAG: peptide/nickel transport system permease protein [Pseudonocardiales bacterium]|nr:peptide/nickel transport system permease protein [Pseudonocardiales bacterium]